MVNADTEDDWCEIALQMWLMAIKRKHSQAALAWNAFYVIEDALARAKESSWKRQRRLS